jgi:hypothetical protein
MMHHANNWLVGVPIWLSMVHNWRYFRQANSSFVGSEKMKWNKWTAWGLVSIAAILLILIGLLKVNNWQVWAGAVGLALLTIIFPPVGFGIALVILLYLVVSHASTLPQQISIAWQHQIKRWSGTGKKKGVA